MNHAVWILTALSFASGTLFARAEDPHIAKIERDIEPPVQVRGQAVTRLSLSDAMTAAHVPAISIAVIEHGKIAWAKAWGAADQSSGTPATPRTTFQAGSVSKPVFASVVMQLVQKGKVDLERPANDQLIGWKIPQGPFTTSEPITLRHLMTHTGGLSVHGFPGYEAGKPLPSLVEVLNGAPPTNTAAVVVERKPGTLWSYSGGGITIAQLLIEDAAKQRLPELARKGVFAPLGMTDSTYDEPLGSDWIAAHHPATGYRSGGAPVPGRFHTYPEMAAAGLWTTPSDLAKWAIALQNAYAGRPSPLMSKSSAHTMLTPGLGQWGIGIQVLGDGDSLRFGHGGDDDGFKTEMVGYLKDGRGMVVMANGDGAVTLLSPILQAIAREYGWPGIAAKLVDETPLDARQAEAFAGSYGHGMAKVVVVGSKITATAGPIHSELIPIGQDQFAILSDGNMLGFVRGPDGKVAKLQAYGATLSRDP